MFSYKIEKPLLSFSDTPSEALRAANFEESINAQFPVDCEGTITFHLEKLKGMMILQGFLIFSKPSSYAWQNFVTLSLNSLSAQILQNSIMKIWNYGILTLLLQELKMIFLYNSFPYCHISNSMVYLKKKE